MWFSVNIIFLGWYCKGEVSEIRGVEIPLWWSRGGGETKDPLFRDFATNGIISFPGCWMAGQWVMSIGELSVDERTSVMGREWELKAIASPG